MCCSRTSVLSSAAAIKWRYYVTTTESLPALYEILWQATTERMFPNYQACVPANETQLSLSEDNLMDWLREYSPENKDEVFVRGFLGKCSSLRKSLRVLLYSQEEKLYVVC